MRTQWSGKKRLVSETLNAGLIMSVAGKLECTGTVSADLPPFSDGGC